MKARCWTVVVPEAAFTLVAGEAELGSYRFGARRERHYFCRRCGIRPFGLGDSQRRGSFYSVNVACLDDVAAAELAAAPVTYVDGRNDQWHTPPAQTAHL